MGLQLKIIVTYQLNKTNKRYSMSVPHSIPEGYSKVKYHHNRHCPNTQEMTFPGPTRFIFQACFCTNFLGKLKINLLIRRGRNAREHWPSLLSNTRLAAQAPCSSAAAFQLSKGLSHTFPLSPTTSFLRANVLLHGTAAPYTLRGNPAICTRLEEEKTLGNSHLTYQTAWLRGFFWFLH